MALVQKKDRRKSRFQSLERAIFGCSIAILQRLRSAALALAQNRTRGKRSLVSSNGIFLDVYLLYLYYVSPQFMDILGGPWWLVNTYHGQYLHRGFTK